MSSKKSSGGAMKLLVPVAIGLAIAGGTKHHGHGILASLASISSSNLSSRGSWARALLRADGLPRTSCNVNAVTQWELAEGGGFGNQAANNPLNVNPGPGAGWPGYNATGAWAFPDAATGLRYTVATLNNGNYGGIISALQAGGNAQAVMNAIQDSPWAASHYGYGLTANC